MTDGWPFAIGTALGVALALRALSGAPTPFSRARSASPGPGPTDCTCGPQGGTLVPITALAGEVLDHRCPTCWLPRPTPARPRLNLDGPPPSTRTETRQGITLTRQNVRDWDLYAAAVAECRNWGHEEHLVRSADGIVRHHFCGRCGASLPNTDPKR